MELVFLGHQSWLIRERATSILVDPLLLATFGHSEAVSFPIYPPRRIDLSGMPSPAGVILTHEHLDHFHLPSLALLPRTCKFFVGDLAPAPVVEAVTSLGFTVTRVALCETTHIGDLDFVLFAASPSTIFWEKRVRQILVWPRDRPSATCFVAVDALLSEEYLDQVAAQAISPPRALVISNNSQVVPQGAYGAHTNLLPIPGRRRANCGVDILNQLTNSYAARLNSPECALIICGNGFTEPRQTFGPFLYSDNRRLASLASELGNGQVVLGPVPGERISVADRVEITGHVPWIVLDSSVREQLMLVQARFTAADCGPIVPLLGEFPTASAKTAAEVAVTEELPALARAAMMAPVGVLALHLSEGLAGPLGSRRIVLRLLTERGLAPLQFALDFAAARFVRDNTPSARVLIDYPFGVEVHLIDFAAVVTGQLQIWDLAGSAMRTWYVGSIYDNVVAFLYCYFGEQVRPDLAAKVYRRALERLRSSQTGLQADE